MILNPDLEYIRNRFRVLSNIDRATIDLTIRCVDRIRSATLARVIVGIVEKIEDAMKGFLVRAEANGRLLVERVVELALSWGNTEGLKWKCDICFVRYLGAMNLGEKAFFMVGLKS